MVKLTLLEPIRKPRYSVKIYQSKKGCINLSADLSTKLGLEVDSEVSLGTDDHGLIYITIKKKNNFKCRLHGRQVCINRCAQHFIEAGYEDEQTYEAVEVDKKTFKITKHQLRKKD